MRREGVNVFEKAKFIDVLKEVHIETYVKLQSTNKLQNLKYKNEEIFIKTGTDKYKNNEINRLEFINNVCYKFLP